MARRYNLFWGGRQLKKNTAPLLLRGADHTENTSHAIAKHWGGVTSLRMRRSLFTKLLSRSGLHNPVVPLLRVGPCVCCGRCLAMDLHVTIFSVNATHAVVINCAGKLSSYVFRPYYSRSGYRVFISTKFPYCSYCDIHLVYYLDLNCSSKNIKLILN
jgi:hypothetical protein